MQMILWCPESQDTATSCLMFIMVHIMDTVVKNQSPVTRVTGHRLVLLAFSKSKGAKLASC